MELKNIRVIIFLVAISLIALIGVQVFWAYRSYRLNEKTFQSKVMEAMRTTVKTMNDNMDCFELFSKAHINPYEGFYMVRQKCDEHGFIPGENNLDTVPMYFAAANKNFPFDYTNLMFKGAMNLEMVLRFKYLFDPSAIQDSSYNKHSEITVQNFRSKLSDKKPINQRYEVNVMDSILKTELQKQSIHEPFQFAYINVATQKAEYVSGGSDSLKIMNSKLKTPLTNNSYFTQPYLLVIYFNNYSQLIFEGIKVMLFTSVFIVIILLISFYIFIKIIFKQRKLSELKNDFINNMTHEFKTPLSNISLALETLHEKNSPAVNNNQKVIRIIGQETERLRENVEKILTVAKLEKEKIQLQHEQLDLHHVIQKTVSGFGPSLNSNGVSLDYSFNAVHSILHADETHLINVIGNLIDNAIKYSHHQCKITIGTENKGEGILFFVRDTGPGMSKEVQSKIFEKFYREPKGDIHNVKGFGLGLSYVKSIIETHHGSVSVKSQQNIGTEFVIYLPFNTNGAN